MQGRSHTIDWIRWKLVIRRAERSLARCNPREPIRSLIGLEIFGPYSLSSISYQYHTVAMPQL